MRLWILVCIALAATLAAPPAQAWPPCTCDPNPITDLLRCTITDGSAPPPGCPDPVGDAIGELPAPPSTGVKDLVEQLDPRNWPCTCDPQPSPF